MTRLHVDKEDTLLPDIQLDDPDNCHNSGSEINSPITSNVVVNDGVRADFINQMTMASEELGKHLSSKPNIFDDYSLLRKLDDLPDTEGSFPAPSRRRRRMRKELPLHLPSQMVTRSATRSGHLLQASQPQSQ